MVLLSCPIRPNQKPQTETDGPRTVAAAGASENVYLRGKDSKAAAGKGMGRGSFTGRNKKTVVSEVGFEPTPPFGDQKARRQGKP